MLLHEFKDECLPAWFLPGPRDWPWLLFEPTKSKRRERPPRVMPWFSLIVDSTSSEELNSKNANLKQ